MTETLEKLKDYLWSFPAEDMRRIGVSEESLLEMKKKADSELETRANGVLAIISHKEALDEKIWVVNQTISTDDPNELVYAFMCAFRTRKDAIKWLKEKMKACRKDKPDEMNLNGGVLTIEWNCDTEEYSITQEMLK